MKILIILKILNFFKSLIFFNIIFENFENFENLHIIENFELFEICENLKMFEFL